MAQDQAGIELILSAPDVKPIMDAVIDDWKEINRQEKLATEQLREFNDETVKHQLRLKEIALSNQQIKDSVKSLGEERKRLGIDQDAQIDKELFAQEHQQKGIFNTIKAYFQQRGELKKLGTEIDSVNKQLQNLQLRQEAISLSARRGNTSAIKEYAANEAAIKKLNGSLNTLIERENVVGAKLDLTKQKFAGLNKTFAVVRAGAIAAAAAIALIAVAIVASVFALGRYNEEVQAVFKKTSESFQKAKGALSNALAPVALAIGTILGKAFERLAKYLKDNQDAIFDWAVGVAGRIAYTAGFFETLLPYIGNLFDKLAKDIAISWQFLQNIINPAELLTGGLEKLKQLEKERAALSAPRSEANPTGTPINPFENAENRQSQITELLIKQKAALLTNTPVVKDHSKEIAKLREEYRRLTEEVQKNIDALEVEQAGPVAGILLRAELNAKALENQSAEYVILAKKLGKAQEEIDNVTSSFNRLIDAARNQAQVEAIAALTATLKGLEDQVADNSAKESGKEDELNLQRRLDLLREQKEATQLVAEQLRGLGDEYLRNKEIYESIIKGTIDAIAQLESDALETFANNKSVEAADKRVKSIQEQFELLKKGQAEIAKEINDVPNISDDRKVFLQVVFEAQQASLNALSSELDTLENKASEGLVFPIQADFTDAKKEFDEFSSNFFFKVDVPDGKTSKPREDLSAQEKLDAVVEINRIAFDTITGIVLTSIDAQIEANNLLIESRQQTVDELEKQVDQEAQFKALGLANDYDILKKRLTGETKLKEEAEKKALELQAKRAKAQRAVEAAQQASSLATAVAQIFASYAGIPFGIGQILAIAGVAAMFASFVASKVQAAQLARAYKGSHRMGDTFGEFAPGEGYDDSPSRNRGLSVVDSSGRLRGFVGGDEYLHKQSVSRQHRGAFDYLNENENKFKDVNLLAMLKALESSPTKSAFDFPDMSNTPRIDYARISKKNEKLRERMIVVNQNNGVTKEELTEAISEAMKGHAQTMIEYLESRPDIIPNEWFKDYTERTSKSSKRFKKG